MYIVGVLFLQIIVLEWCSCGERDVNVLNNFKRVHFQYVLLVVGIYKERARTRTMFL